MFKAILPWIGMAIIVLAAGAMMAVAYTSGQ